MIKNKEFEKENQMKNIGHLIATTRQIERRLKILRSKNVKNKNFKPNELDFYRDYSKYTEDKKSYYEGGYSRFLTNKNSIIEKQVKDLKDLRQESDNRRIRFITTLPKGSDYNKLRDIFLDIQERAEMYEKFLFTSISEKFENIKDYIEKRKDKNRLTLVLDMEMSFEEFSDTLNWACRNLKEVVIIYRDWKKNINNLSTIFNVAKTSGHKIHISKTFWSVNAKSKEKCLAPLFIAQGIKSVSIEEAPIPNYILKYTYSRPPRTNVKILEDTIWLTDEIETSLEHSSFCSCIDESKFAFNIISCVTYHNLEKLSKLLKEIKEDKQKREEVLQFEVFKEIIAKVRSIT